MCILNFSVHPDPIYEKVTIVQGLNFEWCCVAVHCHLEKVVSARCLPVNVLFSALSIFEREHSEAVLSLRCFSIVIILA